MKLAGDELDQGAFAGAVRSDQPVQSRFHVEGNMVEAHDDAVPTAQIAGLKNDAHSGLNRRRSMITANVPMTNKARSALPAAGSRNVSKVSGFTFLRRSPNTGILSCASLTSS